MTNATPTPRTAGPSPWNPPTGPVPALDGLAELQAEVAGWAAHNFPAMGVVTAALGLAEEVGEVCRAVLKGHEGIRGTAEEWRAEAAKEVGDATVKLLEICEFLDLRFDEVVTARWASVRTRDWVADPLTGGQAGIVPTTPAGPTMADVVRLAEVAGWADKDAAADRAVRAVGVLAALVRAAPTA